MREFAKVTRDSHGRPEIHLPRDLLGRMSIGYALVFDHPFVAAAEDPETRLLHALEIASKALRAIDPGEPATPTEEP